MTRFDKKILQDIPQAKGWSDIIPVDKGWSPDQKFYITTYENREILLRLSDISQYDKKKAEYDTVREIYKLGLNMSEPIEFGVCEAAEKVYMVLSWLDGEPAEEALPRFLPAEQYDLGVAAGEALNKIHTIPAPRTIEDWSARLRRKVAKKLEQYRVCGIQVPNDRKILDFIHSALDGLTNIPQTIQHGDFHVGNFVIQPRGKLGIIDFNRSSYGDPWEEFDRMVVFSRRVSIPFIKGQIDGYFGDKVPESFFQRLALYAAMNALFSVVWSIQFGEEAIKDDLARSEMLYQDFNGFDGVVPGWTQ